MSEISAALAEANQLKPPAERKRGDDDLPPREPRRFPWVWVAALGGTGLIAAAVMIVLSRTESRAKLAANTEKSDVSAVSTTTAVVAKPSAFPTPVQPMMIDPDPELAAEFARLTLNAILPGDPARASFNGRVFSPGQEILPGLKLLRIEANAVLAEDGAGALYRRKF